MVNTSVAEQAQTIAELRQQLVESLLREEAKDKKLQERDRQLAEAVEQQTATSEVLRVIASSPTDIQPVLDTVAENAARLCDARDADILRAEGDILRRVASYGAMPRVHELPITRGIPGSRAVIDRQTVHVHDLQAGIETDFPDARTAQQLSATRTILAAPLLREGVAIGCIAVRRMEVRPFTDKQIKLLETFADQAIIAIENARLFHELTHRTGELETSNAQLREALDQQTATSDILRIIASSPTDIQPVLEAVAESATRLCEAHDAYIGQVVGDILRLNAHSRDASQQRDVLITRGHIAGQAIVDRRTVHIHDLAAEPEGNLQAPSWRSLGIRTVLATPLMREGVAIGTIIIRRMEIRPFTEKQIALLKTFANQAVIAIENVYDLKELQERNRDLTEALEQQTATGEVLRVIASSPTELQPVLDTVIANAVRLIGAEHGHIRQYDGEFLQLVAYDKVSAEGAAAFQEKPVRPGRETGPGRAFLERKPIHIPDVELDPTFELPPVRLRTFLAVPMLREGIPIGTISIWRETVAPFTERQIELVTTFADQAVIAIENVRLFRELQERNRDLTEALEQQTATSEILRVIASSPTDIQPVLDVVAENAARVCGATDATMPEFVGLMT